MPFVMPHIAFGTPRRLPKPKDLPGRVVVLDIAFAAEAGNANFKKVTQKFMTRLGDRLAMWVDHHDHERHVDYDNDPRFMLRTKAQHGACPEMITPELVARAGEVETVCCHTDFDGLCAAAKWIRGGLEPYEGADQDAHAIDTRMGTPSPRANVIDRALRARPRDMGLRGIIVRFLVDGATDAALFSMIREASDEFTAMEQEAQRLALAYEVDDVVAVVDARERHGPYDKTLLLLLGQKRARVSVVYDETTVTCAAAFDSGVNLLTILGLEGGMPTRVSVATKKRDEVLEKVRAALSKDD